MKNILYALAATAALIGGAKAQTFPTQPIKMIVPFAAGGPTDVIARLVGEHMSKTLGQPVTIENITGAGGTTGITLASQAKPDGYTIMMGHMGTHGAAPALYPDLKYDPARDFEPIGMAAGTPVVIVARKDFPAKDLKEFAAYLKTNGDKIKQAHAGIGAVSQMTCVMLNSQVGANPTTLTFTGSGPILSDLMAGKVDYACDQIVNLVTQIKAGSIRAYAIASAERSPVLPDVPTTAEAGLPDYQVTAWNAAFAPKGTPKDIVVKLNAALGQAIDDPATRKALLDLGAVLPQRFQRGSEWLRNFVVNEIARWTPVLKVASAK
ncbi:MAG: hypothetical protein JWL62_2259 [Hyphomicrobiales bacterium]|nr:hypothetical protein [Hyphomicrobiales bacterium]